MLLFEFQLLLAIGLDLLAGDPRWFPHPVRMIGFLCNNFEKLFRMVCSSVSIAGLLTVISVLFITLTTTAFILAVLHQISPLAAQIFAVFLLYTTIAIRDLLKHSKEVYTKLTGKGGESLGPARNAVAMIVGRDTSVLDKKGIIRATIETVAENMVDGITAPLFYAICATLLSPITGINPIYLAVSGAIGYKAVNTMDSMIAYKNKRYLVFGKWAAYLDDRSFHLLLCLLSLVMFFNFQLVTFSRRPSGLVLSLLPAMLSIFSLFPISSPKSPLPLK